MGQQTPAMGEVNAIGLHEPVANCQETTVKSPTNLKYRSPICGNTALSYFRMV